MKFNRKKFTVLTLGCKLNIYESESLSYMLEQRGWSSESEIYSDVVIINTCTVTLKADAKSRAIIRRVRKKNKNALIIVTGCTVTADIDQIKDLDEPDYIFENKNKSQIVDFIDKHIYRDDNCNRFFSDDHDYSFDYHNGYMTLHSRAFVKIQDGCDNFCSYCKIPYARGRNRSRTVDSIIREISLLVDNQYEEIVFTGINIGEYNSDNTDFASLLKLLLKEFHSLRFRLGSIEPQNFNNRLFDVISDDRVCPHFHVPLQSGTDEILSLMNRKYNTLQFQNIIEELRVLRTDPMISTDLILGFPGETDYLFEKTKEFIKNLDFAFIHLFPFSPRKGTKAFNMTPVIPERIRSERMKEMEMIVQNNKIKYEDKFIDKKVDVVIEHEKGRYYTGKSENYLDIIIHKDRILKKKAITPVIIKERVDNKLLSIPII